MRGLLPLASLSAAALLALGAAPAFASAPDAAVPGVRHFIHPVPVKDKAAAARLHAYAAGAVPAPPTIAQCEAAFGSPCYGPGQLAHAYGADSAQRLGLDGAGATIALVDLYGSPTIRADLAAFDRAYGLPDAHLDVATYGSFTDDLSTPDELGWGQESTLDVEYAHAMAPKARLLLVQVAPDSTNAQLGTGNLAAAMSWAVKRYHIDAMSLSWGDMEANFTEATGGDTKQAAKLLDSLRGGLITAAQHHVTVLVASGDDGPTGPTLDGSAMYPFRTVSWPASDPLATAVGGTLMHLVPTGARVSPDSAWSRDGIGAAGGGGQSVFFAAPRYQQPVTPVVGAQRGLPDLALNSSCDSPVNTYVSFGWSVGDGPGWQSVCGTSEAAPLLAGLVADAAAKAGHPLGQINPALYTLSAKNRMDGVADVTDGCTDDFGVTGFCATAGYDLATGWGTVGNATEFALTLAHARR
jgi:subtilase family serine protease